ncbi:hypothetical protein [Legionella erythra]|uniref:Uncharacterized protein n=1 Tax=Legionella erythra TaxID=448 RepID=A0A0W0TFZ9_LEGER|nr:hypothetical protein [Legionella erythra]KTC94519.1 hypothetical protein Lery_2686 [Legionella erythra]
MLNELIKKLYSAWQTFDLGKGDYDSELFKSYKNKFLTEALDSVSKATVLMEMAGKKLPPDAAMLAELIQHLATDAKKTNDIAIYIHIEQIYDLFCLLFVPNDELHKVTYTALKEGKRNKGIAQVRTLKNYSQEMNSFFETEKIRIDKSRIQAKKTEATSRAESSNKKPKEKGITTTAKPQHKECSNPKLQAIINLFPSPLFNKKIYSTLGDCETIHANEFMNLRLADMKAKYYNFLLLPRALDYPEAHAQVLVNLLDEQDRDLDWKLILAIYNNAWVIPPKNN